ncbi:SGNH/GDSL hydrolase family protein [Pleionea litopenaei]|uniref:SGNH/GDSL hydrolase family protein n=1 Tax=Pleionea litopenaei TaxID=3070815 RepID=A0AA51RV09_9GAMM|nr:SGNH/GDSL hydrolase family protein [Pleionea sp. HL-JVS1]WMS88126.1 SGNH/GDSL hydrolase family protein [Pleionea sp. HL-JVS1]
MNLHRQLTQVFFWGDSFTAGENDYRRGGWTARVSAALMKRNHLQRQDVAMKNHWRAYPLGIGGETVDGLLRRFESEFKSRAVSNSRRLVCLQYGSNDVEWHKQKNRVPLPIFIRKYQQVLTFFQAQGAEVLGLSIWPTASALDGEPDIYGMVRHRADLERYNDALKTLVEQNRGYWVNTCPPTFHRDPGSWLDADGVHPSAQGHAYIALQILRSIRRIN